jgi:hypothetical protein
MSVMPRDPKRPRTEYIDDEAEASDDSDDRLFSDSEDLDASDPDLIAEESESEDEEQHAAVRARAHESVEPYEGLELVVCEGW